MNSPTPAPIIKANRKRCVILIALGVGLGIAIYVWLLPWLHDFSARSICVEVAGINGIVLLSAATFIGLPLCVFVVTLWVACYARRMLKSGQFPPPGAWVCRDTVPVTGKKVKIRAYFGLLMPLFGLAILGWGIFTFHDFKHRVLDPGLEKAKAACHSEQPGLRQGVVP